MTTNKEPNGLPQLLDFLSTIDLQGALALADNVAPYIPLPWFPQIVKALRIIVQLQPLVKTGARTVQSIKGNTVTALPNKPTNSSSLDVTRFITPPAHLASQDALNNFVYYMKIAAEDEVVTREEQEWLEPQALKAGYTVKEFNKICYNINHHE